MQDTTVLTSRPRPSRRVLGWLAAVSDRLTPPPAGVTILIYHRVGGGSDSAVDLAPEVFERQLDHLAEHHTVLTIADAVAALRGDEGWATSSRPADDADERAVVITFDDGTTDFAEFVVPALLERGLPATLYVATAFVNNGTPFPWGAPPIGWGALRDAASTGLVTIGSHTHTHRLLDRLDPDDLADDLQRSVDLIAEHMTKPPAHFAYPKAVPGSPSAEIDVRRRFASAALAGNRVNRAGATDLHRLGRTPITRRDDAETFAAKASGGLRLEGAMRDAAARIRYRSASR